MINFQLYNSSKIIIKEDAVRNVINLVLGDHGYSRADISIVLMDDDSLKTIKKKYFGEDLYTDVISFNIEEEPFEGELYISYERVASNAIEFNEQYQIELKRVIIHGLLHLCGHEDTPKKEKSKMIFVLRMRIDSRGSICSSKHQRKASGNHDEIE